MGRKTRIIFTLSAALGLYYCLGVVFKAVWNTDELTIRPLGCMTQKYEQPDVSYVQCKNMTYNLFGWTFPARASNYHGIRPSLAYYPMSLIWDSVESYRMLGFVDLVALSAALSWLCGLGGVTFLLVAFSFPIVFCSLIDAGPVAYHFASLIVIPALLVLGKRKYYSFLAGFLFFWAIETKPIYFAFCPALVVFTALLFFIFWKEQKLTGKILLSRGLYFSLGFLPLAILLWFAKYPDGTNWYQNAFHRDIRDPFSLSQLVDTFMIYYKKLHPFMKNFLNFAHYSYNVADPNNISGVRAPRIEHLGKATVWFWFVFSGISIFQFIFRKRSKTSLKFKRNYALFWTGWLVTFIIAFGLCMSHETWSSSHAIFLLPYVYVSIAAGLANIFLVSRPLAWAFVFCICFSSSSSFRKYQEFPPIPPHNLTNPIVFKYLSSSGLLSRSVAGITEWGYYDFVHSFGPRDQVLAQLVANCWAGMDRCIQEQTDALCRIAEVAKQYKRDLILIKLEGGNQDFFTPVFREVLPGILEIPIPGVDIKSSPRWSIWQMAQSDLALEKKSCRKKGK